ncbi:MAG: hypothetical protein KAS32_01660 [Candidatus Peribacteraceae bacterium]|nr:hypothetical protein [Candidatus Peribacteraceae bacterium]
MTKLEELGKEEIEKMFNEYQANVFDKLDAIKGSNEDEIRDLAVRTFLIEINKCIEKFTSLVDSTEQGQFYDLMVRKYHILRNIVINKDVPDERKYLKYGPLLVNTIKENCEQCFKQFKGCIDGSNCANQAVLALFHAEVDFESLK